MMVNRRYIAAWMAGLRCKLFPQQGVATYEVPIVASAPSMHTKCGLTKYYGTGSALFYLCASMAAV